MNIYFKSIHKLAGLASPRGHRHCSRLMHSTPGQAREWISTSPDVQTVSWHEFGRTISVSYEKSLAASAGAATVPAVPVSDQILFAEAHPAYVQIRFLVPWGWRLPTPGGRPGK